MTVSKDPLYDNAPAWTKEQYELMQEHAHLLGYYLITPFRKGLKNIKVGVINEALASPPKERT
jgi:hypothetical protein